MRDTHLHECAQETRRGRSFARLNAARMREKRRKDGVRPRELYLATAREACVERDFLLYSKGSQSGTRLAIREKPEIGIALGKARFRDSR